MKSIVLATSVVLFACGASADAIRFNKIESAGRAIIYIKENPVDITRFDVDDSEVYVPLWRFRGYVKADVKVVVASGKSVFSYEVDKNLGEIDISSLNAKPLSEKECAAYIDRLINAVRLKNGAEFSKLYFSAGAKGLNPDLKNKKTGKMSSDAISEIISTGGGSISGLKCILGTKFSMICDDDGHVPIRIGGKVVNLPPVYIFKDANSLKLTVI